MFLIWSSKMLMRLQQRMHPREKHSTTKISVHSCPVPIVLYRAEVLTAFRLGLVSAWKSGEMFVDKLCLIEMRQGTRCNISKQQWICKTTLLVQGYLCFPSALELQTDDEFKQNTSIFRDYFTGLRPSFCYCSHLDRA
jgi:hypothetical protein